MSNLIVLYSLKCRRLLSVKEIVCISSYFCVVSFQSFFVSRNALLSQLRLKGLRRKAYA